MQLNQYIDHTLLKPTATPADILSLCKEAIEHKFYAVCVHPAYLEIAKSALKNSEANNLGSNPQGITRKIDLDFEASSGAFNLDYRVKIAAVIGFPLGAMTTEAKVFETKNAVEIGADEVDMVINIGMLKAGETDYIETEISEIKKAIGSKILKVIIETCYLTNTEKELACRAALNAKADFVKTSTGFGTGGATFEDVKLMKKIAGDTMKIKASGGIKDRETALKYIELGVSRLGTSSGIQLVTLEDN